MAKAVSSMTTSSAEMGDDDQSGHEREINSQDLGKRLRASRKTKRQARKGNIAARPAAGLPMDTQRYASRSSARLRGLPSVSSTAGAGERELHMCQELLQRLPRRSAYAQHRRRCVQKAIDLLSREDRTDLQAQELAGLLHQLELQ